MLSRASITLARRSASRLSAPCAPRLMSTTIDDALLTADDAFKKSGYIAIDYTILEDSFVYDAVQKFAAFNIGCLVTVDNRK
jgi:predicted transcriptional regulator